MKDSCYSWTRDLPFPLRIIVVDLFARITTCTVYAARAGNNQYGTDVEVDYRGEEVTVENFIRLLTGRHHPATPRSKRLLTDHQSNVLIYLTGHGGDSFLKFQDAEELTNVDLAYAIQTMYEDNRYNEVFLIADTCRSASMYEWVASPGVLSTSSSLTHEESYSYDVDDDIGVYVIDRYTHFTVAFLNREVTALNSTATMQDYLDSCSRRQCLSTVGVRKDVYPKEPSRVRATDFFGSSRMIRHLTEEIVVDDEWMSFSG
ncbi:peptidase C13 family protein [Ancylostoma caninum]|uniref:Peptidase C13 family protein n=1 Tax=Ancylostoma caninum TaxID=29170 RepID=A0A368FNL2_ANCCA|nr:peptidase C13 family protein [Ancylostoma caninum]